MFLKKYIFKFKDGNGIREFDPTGFRVIDSLVFNIDTKWSENELSASLPGPFNPGTEI